MKGVIIVRAVLRYTDCLQDGRKVFFILAQKNIKVLKTKQDYTYPEITIFIENWQKLNELVAVLNKICLYEVRIVETRESDVCDSCSNYDSCPRYKKFFHGFFCR